MQVEIAVAQAIAIAFLQRRAHQQRHVALVRCMAKMASFRAASHGARSLSSKRMPGGHFDDVGARVQVVTIQHGGAGSVGDGAGHGGSAAGNGPSKQIRDSADYSLCHALWELARARHMRPN